jgi:hypothetical protein
MNSSGNREWRTGNRALLFSILCALRAALPVQAQDTVQVISPEVRSDSARTVLPESVIREVIAHYNDSLTTRILGPFTLPAGAQLRGPVSVFGGPLTIRGTLVGAITVINSYLLIEAGGVVEGNVLVVGGQILLREGGQLDGSRREYRPIAQVIRTSAGLLAPRPPPRSLGELASAQRSFQNPYFRTTLSLETGLTYNRVEGFPIVLGPTFSREGLRDLDAKLDLRGIVWTAPDRTNRRADFGYAARAELRFGTKRQFVLAASANRRILPIEPQPLSPGEVGLAAVLLQRDYRDYYQAQGFGGEARYDFGRLALHGSLRRDSERSVPATDPFSVVRDEGWRPNPLIDDGHFLTVRLGVDFDTRNQAENPAHGWLVQAWWERTRSSDASPLTLPPEVRQPVPPGVYASERVWLDVRRYERLNPDVRIGGRLLAAGWVNGDPLPVQRRFSLGGPDLLPGYPFRSQSCLPASFPDPAGPALCDRMIAAQLEVRTRARIGLTAPARHPWLAAGQRLFSIRDPDIVIMGNAGKAWVTGEGPGRVPNHRIPEFREWQKDIGIGLDFGGIGIYAAQPLTRGFPLLLSARLQKRF